MSCDYCDEHTDDLLDIKMSGGVFPYHWGRAVVVITGCAEHVREVMDALNKAQEANR